MTQKTETKLMNLQEIYQALRDYSDLALTEKAEWHISDALCVLEDAIAEENKYNPVQHIRNVADSDLILAAELRAE